ncbi:heterotetrameric sarcosine oxidase delta subunit [Rhizobium sp. PP-F2F-G38]|uniref:Sarcosine oxidase subunit delta n=1 Tax=Ferranicluibacter rubi TaxID=2715133 RepID=A0AA43ZJ11_9HYPH|nr:sarcosine oxidase subunit delta [Ferranicluibacter rubi]PYE24522.1 heterotetrameric sarcosine oxidase delta subunit [Rhizobium sp. PP-CC-3A-592]PYE33460.1 heterotetrameric sarcosine oxidase delta subunit [Rhizobium sp. PP-WC-1G-195]PYE41741.1 heterotetrameric sarcosine oxidase delta subunit [Rhizobium sp. PP-F2F-G20b]PYE98282.1 heterotetrameric sarcosine oxidase delta subunit [Rhizobium sp. PP-F2F-G38]TCL91823.1 heterotetrameric sarcosine oxidase delta subunit [Rhizobium sp. PP-WC-2G-219]T
MLLIHCPYCEEERSELEFRAAGDAHIARPENIAAISDEEFEEYFFLRDNPKGLIFERWRHIAGCGRFFNAARDTVSDRFLKTYKAGEPKPSLPIAAMTDETVVETYEATEGRAE